jgi:hypothetical protein
MGPTRTKRQDAASAGKRERQADRWGGTMPPSGWRPDGQGDVDRGMDALQEAWPADAMPRSRPIARLAERVRHRRHTHTGKDVMVPENRGLVFFRNWDLFEVRFPANFPNCRASEDLISCRNPTQAT